MIYAEPSEITGEAAVAVTGYNDFLVDMQRTVELRRILL